MTEYKWRRGDENIVANLRHKWPDTLKRFTDLELAAAYAEFSMTEYHGNNDERFVEFIFMTDG